MDGYIGNRARLYRAAPDLGHEPPDVRIDKAIVVCPDCGKGTVNLPAHRRISHGIGNVA